MRTRSQARRLRQQQRQQQQVPPNLVEPPKDTMADNRTMAELLQAPTEGYEDAIVVPEIAAANFEIKHGLLTLVQNKQFFGHDKEDPHAHIRYFNKITSTLRYPNVPTTSIKLMLFPFSLEGAARIWLEKEPPRSIQTWDDLVAKFINQFFPPSKTTNLRNEITNFKQRFDESFSEAWDRFKDLLRACPHHGFSELHQLDTFYNALNVNDQDSLNSAAGGNFLDKRPADCSSIIESKSKVRHSRSKAIVAKVSTSASTSGVSPDVAELKDMVRALLLDKQTSPVPAPAPVKAVEQSCVTCGGAHSYRNCPATDSNNYRDNIQEYVSQAAAANFNQGNSGYRPPPMANQIRPPGFPPMQHNNQANNQNRWNQNQNRGNGYNQGQIQRPQVQQQAPMYQPPVNQHPAYQAPAHQASGVSKCGQKLILSAYCQESNHHQKLMFSYNGPQIPPPVVEVETEETKDTVRVLRKSQMFRKLLTDATKTRSWNYAKQPVLMKSCSAVILKTFNNSRNRSPGTAEPVVVVHGEECDLKDDDQSWDFQRIDEMPNADLEKDSLLLEAYSKLVIFKYPSTPNGIRNDKFTCPYGTFAYSPHALWRLQCTRHIPEMYDGNLPRHDRKNDGDWEMNPFENYVDASDFALVLVFGATYVKHFRPIHYASNTMNEAESRFNHDRERNVSRGFWFLLDISPGKRGLGEVQTKTPILSHFRKKVLMKTDFPEKEQKKAKTNKCQSTDGKDQVKSEV
ncbi:reverse transcriptase domain-containing protein [Tanacetum coccineum]